MRLAKEMTTRSIGRSVIAIAPLLLSAVTVVLCLYIIVSTKPRGSGFQIEPPRNFALKVKESVIQDDERGDEAQELLPITPRFHELNSLPPCGSGVEVQDDVKQKLEDVKKQFLACITPIVEQWRVNPKGMVGKDWVEKVTICDQLPVFKTLGLDQFVNKQEAKFQVLPKCKEDNIHVTFGIGRDTAAEESLNRTQPNTKFFGADPVVNPNRRLFSTIGMYFPFAVGKSTGVQRFSVLPNLAPARYVHHDVVTVDFRMFLEKFVKVKKIDSVWFDMEGGELDIIDELHRGAGLDQDGVAICQFMLEIHAMNHPNGDQRYHDFIFRVLEEQRYIFLNSAYMTPPVHHFYFLNIENKECVAKYFNKF